MEEPAAQWRVRHDLLIFDWDGTLADSAAQIVDAMQNAIAALDLPPRDDTTIRELIGLGLPEVMERLYPEIPVPQSLELLARYRQHFVGSGLREAPLFAGVIDTLRSLHEQGYRLSVATGKSRKGLNRALAHHAQLQPLFSSTRTADETANKPDPLMLRELLEQENLPPAHALMIGDTEYDAAMATAIGMPMLGVACGVHAPQRILKAGARAIIGQVSDLPRWLRAPNG